MAQKSITERDRIVQELIKLRIDKFASTKTMLEYLHIQYGYEQSYSYELIRLSKSEITKIFKEEHEDAFNNAVARLDELIENTKSEKIRLEAEKEKNKLLGLYKPVKQEIDVNVTAYKVKIPGLNNGDTAV